MQEFYITNSCIIRNNQVIKNGKVDFVQEEEFVEFSKSIYKKYGFSHSKFFKMDHLSKLGWITSEILLSGHETLASYESIEKGVVIANANSSLDTDTGYYNDIKNRDKYFPSPSVFVYTLPNIMIGEICIKNNIKGENAFFISEKFDPEFTCNYVNSLFEQQKINFCIAGWVDFIAGQYESFLYTVERKPLAHSIVHNAINTQKIYQQGK